MLALGVALSGRMKVDSDGELKLPIGSLSADDVEALIERCEALAAANGMISREVTNPASATPAEHFHETRSTGLAAL